PGLKAADIDVSIDKGLLIISGERKPARVVADDDPRDDTRTYAQERFTGSFRRVIELPQNADPERVQARYTNGCLSVTVGKREASRPRAITVQ
ncbi:Hsp20/alpha crystallin family protein, partial [Klebsiella pneumoniae]|nr:Hsp20/alpha crystallin family protein [Klebsiella pneumoniae]